MATISNDAIEEAKRKASGLSALLTVGSLLSLAIIGLIVWILKDDALSGGGAFGGTMIIIIMFATQLFLVFAMIFSFMRSGYGLMRIFLFISILPGLVFGVIGAIFSGIALFKMSGARLAYPSEVEKIKRREEAKAKGKKKEILELECPDCGTEFKVKDKGKRPLAIKCPECGAEGEI